MYMITSPNCCLGAINAIDFLLETYHVVLDECAFLSLNKAKEAFEKTYEEIKHLNEDEEIGKKQRLITYKAMIKTYGKVYVSKDIENDSDYQDIMQQIDESLKKIKNSGPKMGGK